MSQVTKITRLISLATPPNITTITQSTEIKKGISSQRIEVELIGTDVSRVYATVIPLSFDPKTEINSWEDLVFDEFELIKVSDGKYAQFHMITLLFLMHIQ